MTRSERDQVKWMHEDNSDGLPWDVSIVIRQVAGVALDCEVMVDWHFQPPTDVRVTYSEWAVEAGIGWMYGEGLWDFEEPPALRDRVRALYRQIVDEDGGHPLSDEATVRLAYGFADLLGERVGRHFRKLAEAITHRVAVEKRLKAEAAAWEDFLDTSPLFHRVHKGRMPPGGHCWLYRDASGTGFVIIDEEEARREAAPGTVPVPFIVYREGKGVRFRRTSGKWQIVPPAPGFQ